MAPNLAGMYGKPTMTSTDDCYSVLTPQRDADGGPHGGGDGEKAD